MTMRMCVAAALLALAACGEKEFDPPERADQVGEAEELYRETLFDTITWADTLQRARIGNEVFASRCRNCHGTLGAGDTEYARARELTVPSLVAPEWRYAASMDSVRHRIFVGHAAGMPTWGVAGISPREIDGAAYYLLERLRPEVLGR
jgi:mono/diheme cytochrome c family protein